ncbi:aconitase X swivel domain-containing protein [Microvirgula aerodenitrificans]|uniref:aconitase X swivel domain-containing protein n=1 Tax=Microvirgula aerodenitrificans TaxID=57480 RepID=UPI002F423FF5
MQIQGRQLNAGDVEAEVFVVDFPFSFIGDFDPETGALVAEGHPLHGHCMAGRVLVCPEGRGGTMGPFILFDAQKRGTAPVAILCNRIDPVLYESAITIDIPVFDRFGIDIVSRLRTGQRLRIRGHDIYIDD